MILLVQRESDTPVYLQIVDQVKSAVARGQLRIGERLPSSREMARTLGLHRATVTRAYELLKGEKFIASQKGRGLVVVKAPVPDSNSPQPPQLFWDGLMIGGLVENRLHNFIDVPKVAGRISFVFALPPTDAFPLAEFRRCLNFVLRTEGKSLLQIGDSLGFAPLRELISRNMSMSGIAATAEEILITNGGQHSLDLIRRVLVAPGETVVLENPTYPGVFSAFADGETRRIGVPVGRNGIDLTALQTVLAHNRVKLIYTVPTFQNPTGATMDLPARQRLLQLAAQYRVPIVEDDIYGELRYTGPAIPSLKALDRDGIVIYMNSFSKMGFPGIRLGWIHAPAFVIERLRIARQSCDLHSNVLIQAVLHEYLKRGAFNRHLKKVRRLYAERREVMLSALKKSFPAEARWNAPDGGMCLWITLPDSIDTTALLTEAIDHGVTFAPGEVFFLSAPMKNTLRLNFTMLDPEEIRQGVKRLSAAIKKHLSRTPVTREFTARRALV